MIRRLFGKHFHSTGGALTLEVNEVCDFDAQSGTHTKTHADGWTITGEVHEDYFTWVNEFKASHPQFGRVWGNFEEEVRATSKQAFDEFYRNHQPREWDYADI